MKTPSRRERMLEYLRVHGPKSTKELAVMFNAELEVMRTEIGVLRKHGYVRTVRCEQCGSHDLVGFVKMTPGRGWWRSVWWK